MVYSAVLVCGLEHFISLPYRYSSAQVEEGRV